MHIRHGSFRLVSFFLAAVLFALSCGWPVSEGSAGQPSNVITAGYSALRDNWDANEPFLNPTTVASSAFGQQFATQLSGSIYGQPLVFNGIVVVTTEKAITYGIDASTGAILWQHAWGTSFDGSTTWGSPFQAATIGCNDLAPDLGSTSTPVIDPATGILYLTTRLEVPAGSTNQSDSHWFLQAIHVTNGQPVSGWPTEGVDIVGTPYNTPTIPFVATNAMQRPGLLLLNHVVYMAFASNCDVNPYRGIVAGVSTTNATMTTLWSDEAGAGAHPYSMGGIWQGGGGIVGDQLGRIVVASGNGAAPTPAPSASPPPTLSESVIALSVGKGGQVAATNFFAPANATSLDASDLDLSAGGPIALPTRYFGTAAIPNMFVEVGKDARVFLLDASNLGGYQQGPNHGDAVLSEVTATAGVWGHPAAYGGQGGYVYIVDSGGGPLQAFAYSPGTAGTNPSLTPAASSTNSFAYASGSAMVTSNGTQAGSAVVWALSGDAKSGGANGRLIAYNALPVNGTLTPLWSASVNTISKFSTPTAWNGHVYVGTRDGVLYCFGLSGTRPLTSAPVVFGQVPVGGSVTVSVRANIAQPLTVTGDVVAVGQQTVAGRATVTSATSPSGPTPSVTPTTVPTAGPSVLPPTQNVALDASEVAVNQPAVGTQFQAGQTLTLQVTYHPTQAGQMVGSLQLPTSAGPQYIPVSGYGSAPGLLTTTRTLSFGTSETGVAPKVMGLLVANSSSFPERITGVVLPRGPYRVVNGPRPGTVLAPRQAVPLSVSFAPVRAGDFPLAIGVHSTGGNVTIPLQGSAVTGQGHLEVGSTTLDFGTVHVGQAATLTETLTNTGNIALLLAQISLPTPPFVVTNAVLPDQSIEPGMTLNQVVTFTPTAPGDFGGNFRLSSSTGQPMIVVHFHGKAIS